MSDETINTLLMIDCPNMQARLTARGCSANCGRAYKVYTRIVNAASALDVVGEFTEGDFLVAFSCLKCERYTHGDKAMLEKLRSKLAQDMKSAAEIVDNFLGQGDDIMDRGKRVELDEVAEGELSE